MFSVFIAFFGGAYLLIKVFGSILKESAANAEIQAVQDKERVWELRNTDDEMYRHFYRQMEDESSCTEILEEVNKALDEIDLKNRPIIALNEKHYDKLVKNGTFRCSKEPPCQLIIRSRSQAVMILLANRGRVVGWRRFPVGTTYKNKDEIAFARWVEKTANQNGADVLLVEKNGWLEWDKS